jgi:hypothetical protein
MKNSLRFKFAILSLFFLVGSSAFAGDLEDLAGKWSAKKTNDQGQKYTQTIEVKKDKFTFKIVDADDKVVLIAKGDVKIEKLGPFKSIKFSNIQAGSKADELEAIDDDRVCIYTLSGNSFSLASNFDKERDAGAALDLYSKVDK